MNHPLASEQASGPGRAPALVEQRLIRQYRVVTGLFFALALYLAVPVWDVPLLGLSLSAPIFFLIAVSLIARPPRPWTEKYTLWIGLAVFIWLGIALSSLANGIKGGGASYSISDVITLIRYMYWLLVFVITVYTISAMDLGMRLSTWLMSGIVILALLRWGEVLFFDRVGAGASRIMTQNNYGFLFSCFAPYVLPPLISKSSKNRVLAWLAALLVWGAVLVNGSRGSWVGVSVGSVLFVLLHLLSTPRRVTTILLMVVVAASTIAAFQVLPENIYAAINSRFSTIDQLDEDKSAVVRELMTQKGARLFLESPIIGVGINNFEDVKIELEVPRLLRGLSQEKIDTFSAHNSFAAYLAETGLAGVIPFGIFLLVLLARGGLAALRLNRRGSSWALAAFSGFIAMLFHMWVITALGTTVTWFIFGILGAAVVIAEKQAGLVAQIWNKSQ